MKQMKHPRTGVFICRLPPFNDIGRELWLSMDDLTRHIMIFPPPVA